jgi:hypothetical protein
MGETPPFQEDYMQVKASTGPVPVQVGKGLIEDGRFVMDSININEPLPGVRRRGDWGAMRHPLHALKGFRISLY